MLHRKLTEHWIWRDAEKLKWWIDVLLTVNHNDSTVNLGMQLYECKRGQSIMSLSNWAKRWGVSKDRARNFFTLLEKDGMISHENIGKSTRITVCNYESYQAPLHDGSPSTHFQLTSNSPQTHPNNKNNKNNNIKDTKVSTSNEQAHSTQNDGIDYKNLIDYFNQKTNGVFRKARYPISEKRKAMIRARIREHGKEAFAEMIHKAVNSNFLKGDNKSGFVANFDWMIRPNNFQKIIEGNYSNSQTHNDSLLTYDQVTVMVHKGELTFDQVVKVQTEGGKVYWKRK